MALVLLGSIPFVQLEVPVSPGSASIPFVLLLVFDKRLLFRRLFFVFLLVLCNAWLAAASLSHCRASSLAASLLLRMDLDEDVARLVSFQGVPQRMVFFVLVDVSMNCVKDILLLQSIWGPAFHEVIEAELPASIHLNPARPLVWIAR